MNNATIEELVALFFYFLLALLFLFSVVDVSQSRQSGNMASFIRLCIQRDNAPSRVESRKRNKLGKKQKKDERVFDELKINRKKITENQTDCFICVGRDFCHHHSSSNVKIDIDTQPSSFDSSPTFRLVAVRQERLQREKSGQTINESRQSNGWYSWSRRHDEQQQQQQQREREREQQRELLRRSVSAIDDRFSCQPNHNGSHHPKDEENERKRPTTERITTEKRRAKYKSDKQTYMKEMWIEKKSHITPTWSWITEESRRKTRIMKQVGNRPLPHYILVMYITSVCAAVAVVVDVLLWCSCSCCCCCCCCSRSCELFLIVATYGRARQGRNGSRKRCLRRQRQQSHISITGWAEAKAKSSSL